MEGKAISACQGLKTAAPGREGLGWLLRQLPPTRLLPAPVSGPGPLLVQCPLPRMPFTSLCLARHREPFTNAPFPPQPRVPLTANAITQYRGCGCPPLPPLAWECFKGRQKLGCFLSTPSMPNTGWALSRQLARTVDEGGGDNCQAVDPTPGGYLERKVPSMSQHRVCRDRGPWGQGGQEPLVGSPTSVRLDLSCPL